MVTWPWTNIRTGLFLVRLVGAGVRVRFAFLLLLVVAVNELLRGLARVSAGVRAVRVLLGLLLRPTLAAVTAARRVPVRVVVVLVVVIVHVLLLLRLLLPGRHPAIIRRGSMLK